MPSCHTHAISMDQWRLAVAVSVVIVAGQIELSSQAAGVETRRKCGIFEWYDPNVEACAPCNELCDNAIVTRTEDECKEKCVAYMEEHLPSKPAMWWKRTLNPQTPTHPPSEPDTGEADKPGVLKNTSSTQDSSALIAILITVIGVVVAFVAGGVICCVRRKACLRQNYYAAPQNDINKDDENLKSPVQASRPNDIGRPVFC